uniref:Uncharacterized protein n=1 Tax=Oryza brachyantha TaxID=4533 RepID=J3LAV6_ORYBR
MTTYMHDGSKALPSPPFLFKYIYLHIHSSNLEHLIYIKIGVDLDSLLLSGVSIDRSIADRI